MGGLRAVDVPVRRRWSVQTALDVLIWPSQDFLNFKFLDTCQSKVTIGQQGRYRARQRESSELVADRQRGD